MVSTPLIMGDGTTTNEPPLTEAQSLHIVFMVQTTLNAFPTRLPGGPKTPVESSVGRPMGLLASVPLTSTSNEVG
jgi:hypothetical protein